MAQYPQGKVQSGDLWQERGVSGVSYLLNVRDVFSAAHRLVGSGGRCETVHGHNFQVTLEVKGQNLNQAGMLVDFGDLKKTLRSTLAELDHSDLNEHPAFSGSSPSSENIARFIWGRVNEVLGSLNVKVASVTVSESDTASARFEPEFSRDL